MKPLLIATACAIAAMLTGFNTYAGAVFAGCVVAWWMVKR